MRGILSAGGYVPYRRLDRATVAEVFGGTPAKGARSVASFDEDTTTMAVEAGRLALASAPAGTAPPRRLWFATADPTYLEKTNATAIHAALRLDSDVPALDFGGAVRSGIGALQAALESTSPTLVVAADVRTGAATSADEAAGGDGAAALLVGDDRDGPLLAVLLGAGSATAEITDRWRTPGERSAHQWEERFGELHYPPIGEDAWNAALKAAGLTAVEIDRLVVTGTNERAVRRSRGRFGVTDGALVDDLSGSVGNTGTAHPLLLLVAALEAAKPGETVAVLNLSDGADAMVLRVTDARADWRPRRTVAAQIEAGGPVAYGKALAWRGMVNVQPPNRPSPDRVSAPAAARNRDWKFGLAQGELAPLADEQGTITTFTVDRLAYSPSPPVIFAVVDFDDGRRRAIELTDVDDGDVSVGDRLEMTFRRLSTADGIANYFWKGRPLRIGRSG